MEDQKETKKSFYGQELQEIKDQLQEIKKEISDLNFNLMPMDRFLSKLNSTLKKSEIQDDKMIDLLLTLIHYNEYKEEMINFYKGINGNLNRIKTSFGIMSDDK